MKDTNIIRPEFEKMPNEAPVDLPTSTDKDAPEHIFDPNILHECVAANLQISIELARATHALCASVLGIVDETPVVPQNVNCMHSAIKETYKMLDIVVNNIKILGAQL
jgi:hypothetical protein